MGRAPGDPAHSKKQTSFVHSLLKAAGWGEVRYGWALKGFLESVVSYRGLSNPHSFYRIKFFRTGWQMKTILIFCLGQ